MATGTYSQCYRYVTSQLAHAGAYAREVGTVALQKVTKYVTAEVPDADRDYYFEKVKGQFVKLSGDAKKWGIERQALENNKTRWKNVCNLTSLVVGTATYSKGLWDHDLLLSVCSCSVFFASEKIKKGIDGYFDSRINAVSGCITLAIQDEPPSPTAIGGEKKTQ